LPDLGQAVGQKLLGEIELAAADHVAVGVPADALGNFDGLGIAAGVDGVLCDVRHGGCSLKRGVDEFGRTR
jgi:hypothetical protein